MTAFFSGTDTHTLREEGNDKNCFVSLIVNNAGTYCAAVTRKISQQTTVTTKCSGRKYEFFGEGEIVSTPTENTVTLNESIIEYFMLDVEREQVSNPLDYLDLRFNEIVRKKEAEKSVRPLGMRMETPSNDGDFFNWIHSDKKKLTEAKGALTLTKEEKELPLFPEETSSKWEPDPTIIHYLCCQMVTSSLIINENVDLKQWIVRHMKNKYDTIFTDEDEFDRWADGMVEFTVNHYPNTDVPADLYDDWDLFISKIAGALIRELESYPANNYLDTYIQLLTSRIYE